jgi:hypothetical protein
MRDYFLAPVRHVDPGFLSRVITLPLKKDLLLSSDSFAQKDLDSTIADQYNAKK